MWGVGRGCALGTADWKGKHRPDGPGAGPVLLLGQVHTPVWPGKSASLRKDRVGEGGDGMMTSTQAEGSISDEDVVTGRSLCAGRWALGW